MAVAAVIQRTIASAKHKQEPDQKEVVGQEGMRAAKKTKILSMHIQQWGKIMFPQRTKISRTLCMSQDTPRISWKNDFLGMS